MIDLLVMAISGVAQRFWGGAQVAEATAGGTGLKFREKTTNFGLATRRSLQVLEQRLDDQMRDLSERLLAVEQEVAKPRRREEDAGE